MSFLLIFVFWQKIDGFLAVLKVTGGSFSPPSQKLPFSVTSVDGDSCLLYCASIDLGEKSPSDKCKGPQMTRSLSFEDSQTSRSRMRIPSKGCLQLVIFFNIFVLLQRYNLHPQSKPIL